MSSSPRRASLLARVSPTTWAPFALVAGLAGTAVVGQSIAFALPVGSTPILPVRDIRPGMKGYGLTVFQGTEPERFGIEVLGTVHNFRPHQDLVLIKTSHPRLEAAKVVKGMSGSPIFIDGKMIGAYAYGWQFGSEPIAGVTPIQSMLDELARPVPPLDPLFDPRRGPALRKQAMRDGSDSARYAGSLDHYDVRAHARQLALAAIDETTAGAGRGPGEQPGASLGAATGASLSPVATPVLLGGMTEGAVRLARELLAPLGLEAVQGAGSGDDPAAEAPARFTNGGAIGVQMISGDVSAMGLGTVTRTEGSKLVAFGHPMMNGGVSAMPTSIGRVLWTLASQMSSFKIGEAVRPLGALVNDRQAAIVVDSTATAPSFPVTVEIDGADGAPHHAWNFQVAHDRFMAPSLLAVAVGNAIEATTSERRDTSWRAKTEVRLSGYGTLTLEDAGVAVGGTPDSEEWAHTRAVRAVGALLNNPWEATRIERVTTRMQVHFARDVYRLRGAQLLADVIDAGQKARVRLDLEPFSGVVEHRTIDVPIPRELAGKDVEIELDPGYAVGPELPAPESVADLMANLPRLTFAADSVIASIRLPEQGVTMNGQVAERLPPGALDALRPVHDTASPEPFVSVLRTPFGLGKFLDGRDRVKVHVRPVLR